MLRQRFLLFLMLIMAITPVWSALGYYAGSLPAELSLEQGSSAGAADNTDHCRHQDEFKADCHASGSSTFHICGDGGLAAALVFAQAYSAHRYEHWQKSVSRSLSFSPEIRPPINTLQP
jgi:hypothetical protein